MFHVEQFFALLGVASVCLGATPPASSPSAPIQQASTPLPCPAPPEPAFSLALASDNPEVAQETSLAFEYLLYGDETEACKHLTSARALDPSSPLPLVGLALLSKDSAERAAYLEQLGKEMLQAPATPVEAFYLSAFLKLLEGNTTEAAKEFSSRADRYARDDFSAAWAILLSHYSCRSLDDDGNFLAEHQDALSRAQSFYDSNKQDSSPACYLRAVIEESLPEVSETALEAARLFSERMPASTVAQNLYGHLLYKSGRFAEAADHFHRAYALARDSKSEMPALRARLYESVALWCCKKDKEALAIRRELNALAHASDALDERNLFLTWESHTLPLRILVLRDKLPTASELNAALNAAAPKGNKQAVVAEAAQCIADTLSARMDFRAGKRAQAINILNKAETHFKKWEQQNNTDHAPTVLVTPIKRLHSACVIAINKAKAELYPSTAETWNDNVRKASRQSYSDSYLPPVIPKR